MNSNNLASKGIRSVESPKQPYPRLTPSRRNLHNYHNPSPIKLTSNLIGVLDYDPCALTGPTGTIITTQRRYPFYPEKNSPRHQPQYSFTRITNYQEKRYLSRYLVSLRGISTLSISSIGESILQLKGQLQGRHLLDYLITLEMASFHVPYFVCFLESYSFLVMDMHVAISLIQRYPLNLLYLVRTNLNLFRFSLWTCLLPVDPLCGLWYNRYMGLVKFYRGNICLLKLSRGIVRVHDREWKIKGR